MHVTYRLKDNDVCSSRTSIIGGPSRKRRYICDASLTRQPSDGGMRAAPGQQSYLNSLKRQRAFPKSLWPGRASLPSGDSADAAGRQSNTDETIIGQIQGYRIELGEVTISCCATPRFESVQEMGVDRRCEN